jgi:hypothetical protein
MSKPQEALSTVVNTSAGRMRPATYHEILAVLRQLEAQAEWEAVRDFAHRLFGKRAHHVQIVTGDAYDDEHYYRVVENVIVYDAEDTPLPYDLTLPYWTRVRPHQDAEASSLLADFEGSLREEEARATEPLSQGEREQILQEYAHEYVQENDLYADVFDLPREDGIFALDEPPPERAGSVLYMLCEQEAQHHSMEGETNNQDVKTGGVGVSP